MPETRLTAFSSGRVTVDSMVSGETLPELTVTETTGGWKLGSRAIGSRGMANRPSTTMAVAIIATVTRRVTAKSAIDKVVLRRAGLAIVSGFSLGWPSGDVPGLCRPRRPSSARDTIRGFSWCLCTRETSRCPAACAGPPAPPASREGIMATTITDYEVTYILRPNLEETEVDERANAIAEGVKTRGGEVVGELEKMGKRRLAYEIDDVREGYYVVMNIRSGPEEQKELERLLRLNESVLRALVIRKGD